MVWLRTHVSLTLLTYIQKNACILAEILDHIKTKQRTAVILSLEGTLSNLDGNVNDDGSEKSPFWISLYFFVRFIRVLFLCLKLCECRCSARCIPTCSYCIYYCTLPSSSASPSPFSMLKVPRDFKQREREQQEQRLRKITLYFWFALFFFVRVIRVLFSLP